MLANDQQNTVLCELGQDGHKEVAYSAYGHRADDAAIDSQLAYNGERREGQTGCYLLGNGYRVFSPVLMRFQAPDSWSPFEVGGLNAYSYTNGDPVNYSDPSGHLKLATIFSMLMAGGDDAFAAGARAGGAGGRGFSRTAPGSMPTVSAAAGTDDILATRGFVQHGGTPAPSNAGVSTLANTSRQGSARTTLAPAGTSRVVQPPTRPSAIPEAMPSASIPGPGRRVDAPKKVTTPPPKQAKIPKPVSKDEFKRMSTVVRLEYLNRGGVDPTARGFHGAVSKSVLDVRSGNRYEKYGHK